MDVKYLRKRKVLRRLDVLPFIPLYAVGFLMLSQPEERIRLLGFLCIPVVLVLHIVLFLVAQSSLKLKSLISFRKVEEIDQATHAFVSMDGYSEIVDLVLRLEKYSARIVGKVFQLSEISFEFRKLVFYYSLEKNSFVKVDYLTSFDSSELNLYSGYKSAVEVNSAQKIWGANEFDIPIPGFLDLFVGHLVAPFFVFQVICLFLWSLDDYWYYSCFTLLMLMFFEGMLCKQRLNGIIMLRNMRKPPIEIYVHRSSEWKLISSDELVPGDIVSLFSRPILSAQNEPESFIPCDVLLLHGFCVSNEAMLTGESVPQTKEGLLSISETPVKNIDVGLDESHVEPRFKRHMLFSGTQLLQHSTDSMKPPSSGLSLAPDGGCIAMVLRTGFRSTQGSLMRKILFATEGVKDSSGETFYFIAMLVIMATIASSIVLLYGLQDQDRNQFRLVLHCIMIITSVVPPELPMELSLAVTSSLGLLSRSLVYCTEPFRISFAGKVDTLCFDKTGTLTKDEMIFEGVVPVIEKPPLHLPIKKSGSSGCGGIEADIVPIEDCCDLVSTGLASCQNLFLSPQGVSGDPLEVAAFLASGFKFVQDSLSKTKAYSESRKIISSPLRKFPFTSELKRMSVIVSIDDLSTPERKKSCLVFVKGAPEVLQQRLKQVPTQYEEIFSNHMRQGKRVIALAFKYLSTQEEAKVSSMTRAQCESDLYFLGFLLFDCEMKVDSKSVIKELKHSGHKLVMITGDASFTAIDVARKLNMIRKPDSQKNNVLILEKEHHDTHRGENDLSSLNSHEVSFHWKPATVNPSDCNANSDSFSVRSFDVNQLSALSEKFDFVVNGDALIAVQAVFGDEALLKLYPLVSIFCRVSPQQKESIINILNECGAITLMCGDGTNDVGALKASHVGISIVNDPNMEKKLKTVKENNSNTSNAASNSNALKGKSSSNARDRALRAIAEMQEQERDPSIIQLGDASIASPFTSRRTSIDSVLTVMRSGRCTLVTTIQVYKVLALNCLVSAYLMSSLYLRGLKQGDIQMTAQGLMTAGLFFFLSQAKPLLTLSEEKPPSSVFHRSVLYSILGQCVVHVVSIVVVGIAASEYVDPSDPSLSPDGKFRPNVINSALFLLSSAIQVNSFVTNYRGHPFTERLQDNYWLWRTVLAVYGLIIVVSGGQIEPLNDFLQVVQFPSASFLVVLLAVFGFNFLCCYSIEHYCRRLM